MTADEFIRRFMRVRRCSGCGRIQDFEHSSEALCERCRVRWNAATLKTCEQCLHSARECTCMPKRVSRAGALCLRRLFFYAAEGESTPEMRMLYKHKDRQNSLLSSFFASELCVAVREETEAAGLGDSVIVTFVPRSKRARRGYGFDQSERLAHALADAFGLECARMLDTKFFARRQKGLSSRERAENAKRNIYATEEAKQADGKYVILLDDMVTTGAGMAVCVERLMRAGALGVLCFSVASKNKV